MSSCISISSYTVPRSFSWILFINLLNLWELNIVVKVRFITLLYISFFFSGSKKDDIHFALLICGSNLAHYHLLHLIFSPENKVIILTAVSEIHVMVLFCSWNLRWLVSTMKNPTLLLDLCKKVFKILLFTENKIISDSSQ